MKNRILVLLAVSFLIWTVTSCAAKTISPTYNEIFENGLGLTSDQIEERYPQLTSSATESIYDKGRSVRWNFPEQEKLILDYSPKVGLNFLDDELVMMAYEFAFSDFKSAYQAVIDITNDIVKHYGNPISQSSDEQELMTRFETYEDFEEMLQEKFEEGDCITETTVWYLSEMDEEKNFVDENQNDQIEIIFFAAESGDVEIYLNVKDQKKILDYFYDR